MRIATINIRHGGGKRAPKLLEHIARINPDILVLTEFRNNPTGEVIREALFEQNLIHQQAVEAPRKTNTVLIASRYEFSTATFADELDEHGHRCLKACFREFDLHGFYFPIKEEKRPVFEFLQTLDIAVDGKCSLLLGDFNTGLHYLDENGATFRCAECLAQLLETGWLDLWRTRNPEIREFSWYSHIGNGFRIDQALGTPSFDRRVKHVFYDHKPRESKSTDHSAMVIDLIDEESE